VSRHNTLGKPVLSRQSSTSTNYSQKSSNTNYDSSSNGSDSYEYCEDSVDENEREETDCGPAIVCNKNCSGS